MTNKLEHTGRNALNSRLAIALSLVTILLLLPYQSVSTVGNEAVTPSGIGAALGSGTSPISPPYAYGTAWQQTFASSANGTGGCFFLGPSWAPYGIPVSGLRCASPTLPSSANPGPYSNTSGFETTFQESYSSPHGGIGADYLETKAALGGTATNYTIQASNPQPSPLITSYPFGWLQNITVPSSGPYTFTYHFSLSWWMWLNISSIGACKGVALADIELKANVYNETYFSTNYPTTNSFVQLIYPDVTNRIASYSNSACGNLLFSGSGTTTISVPSSAVSSVDLYGMDGYLDCKTVAESYVIDTTATSTCWAAADLTSVSW